MLANSNITRFIFGWTILGLVAGLVLITYEKLWNNPVIQSPAITSLITSYADSVKMAAPAVVSIRAISQIERKSSTSGTELLERFLGNLSPHGPKSKTILNSGSGVILSTTGYIITNYHVISSADRIIITLSDGRSSDALLVGSDPETDIAILKISLNNLPIATIADIKNIETGDVVLAIGYPYEIGQTVTQGIISATGRKRVSQNTYENFIQTDAAINPGNSGGALINTKGEIIGINSIIYTKTGSYQGISFAIPIDLAHDVLTQIITNGYVVRGWLGLEGKELTQQILAKIGLTDISGILVTEVDMDGPGEKAGIRPGDIITHINDQPIIETTDVLTLVANGKPGEAFSINGIRNRQSFSVTAMLAQRPFMSKLPN